MSYGYADTGMVNLGLALIVIAWVIQAQTMKKGKSTLSKNFVLLYIIGSAILTFDGFSSGMTGSTLLNLFAAIAAFWVFSRAK